MELCFTLSIMKTLSSINNSLKVFTDTYSYLKKSEDTNLDINDLKTEWAKQILKRLHVNFDVIGKVSEQSKTLFLGNHISYLDIPLLMATAKNISFVAKHELNAWPVFGKAARKVDTVFVKREDADSRKSARRSVCEALQNGKRVTIFPSGTTCMHENKVWRKGAFEIAKELNIWVQPFRITYSPLRAAAYIDQDFFPTHLYNLSCFEKIHALIEFHKPVKIDNPSASCNEWQSWSRGLISGIDN